MLGIWQVERRTRTVRAVTRATSSVPGSAFWHRTQWAGGCLPARAPGACLDFEPVLADPGKHVHDGPGLEAVEFQGVPGIADIDDACLDFNRLLAGRLGDPFISLVERGNAVFGGPGS